MSVFHHGRPADRQLVRRIRIRDEDGVAVLAWETHGDHPHEVIVFRSYQGFAGESADLTADDRQTLVYRGSEKRVTVRDEGLQDSVLYYYSVFARGSDGAWHEQLKKKFRGGEVHRSAHPDVPEDWSRVSEGPNW